MSRTGQGWRVALAVGAALSGQTVQAQAPAGSDAPVTVGVGQLDSLTRLSFSWPQGSAGVSAKQAGDVLELRFSRAGAPRLAELHSTPPPRLRDIERISRPGAALVLRLELAPQTSHRAFVEGGRVIVDLISPGAAPSPAGVVRATVEQAKDPSPASGVLPVEIVEETDGARVRLRWPRPAKAAAFRRGEAVYILFDSRAVLEIGDVARANRFFSGVSEVRGEGVVGLRFAVGPSIQVSAGAKGSEWSFFLSESVEGERSAAEIEPIDTERLRTGFGELAVNFGRPGVVRWLEDPEIGDRFAAALLDGPALGLDGRKITLEAALLPAAHGAVVEARADGVAARFEGGRLTVSRGGGLLASAPAQPALPVSEPPLLRPIATADARKTIDALSRDAAVELGQLGGVPNAHLELAKTLLSLELAPEAQGVLRSALNIQAALVTEPDFRLLRGAASAMMGRLAEARTDLNFSGLMDDPSASLWRGYVAARAGAWSEARRNLEQGRDALFAQPQAWRVRMRLALAESALALGDYVAAESAIAEAAGEIAGADAQEEAELLRGRLAAARGETDAAIKIFEGVSARKRNEMAAVAAEVHLVKLRRSAETLQADAVERLEQLRFRWRGDELESEIISALGQAYADQRKWREALSVMHASAARYPRSRTGRQMRTDTINLFERLFLAGEADALPPIQALALFYEFKDLTPVGARGDALIRRLVQRMVKLDLLEQAAALLQHQVDNRLRGLEKADVAVELASIYLSDAKAAQALAVIDRTRIPNLPKELLQRRRLLEAAVLIRLGRYDHAAELIGEDDSPDAQRARAEIAWRQQDWPAVQVALKGVLPPAGQAELDADARGLVLRAAVAGVFAEDDSALAGLRRSFLAAMSISPEAAAFEILTLSPSVADLRLRDVARQLARVDLLEQFLARLRGREEPVTG